MKRTAFLLLLFLSLWNVSCEKKSSSGKPSEPAQYEKAEASPKEWDNNKRAGITYQLLVYSFADKDGDGWGDFAGLTDKLDYIDALGANAIWLSPIHPAMSYHGYDVTDYATVNPRYGDMNGFKQFVAAAHQKNIKVYLDYVINHTGRSHTWFTQALSGTDNPYRDYYIFSEKPLSDISAGKIPMIATEGANGYDSGQWFGVSKAEAQCLKFTLDWSSAAHPTVTVTKASVADPDNSDTATEGAKYLYFGDGVCKKFYAQSPTLYTLSVDFASDWGFLIRTSNDAAWNVGTKFGAADATKATVTYGVPFPLFTSNTSNNDVYNLTLPGMIYYHSHFWTDWFADLNYGAVETAENAPAFLALVNDAKIWIDAGVDGFRLDAVKHIYHNEFSDENPRFLKKFYDAVNGYYRAKNGTDMYMVGEVFSAADKVAPYYAGLPALFEFSFWWALQNALQNGTGSALAQDILALRTPYTTFRSNPVVATKLSNHDEVRARTYLGNSAGKARVAGAVLLTAAGAPYVYYGEELGYTGTKDNGDEYVRAPMLWGDGYTTSYTSKVDPALAQLVPAVPAQEADPNSALNMYRTFARARNTYAALAQGDMTAHATYNATNSAGKEVAVWYRTAGSERMLVMHNMSGTTVTLTLDAAVDKLAQTVACQGSVLVKKEELYTRVMMEGYSSVVFELK